MTLEQRALLIKQYMEKRRIIHEQYIYNQIITLKFSDGTKFRVRKGTLKNIPLLSWLSQNERINKYYVERTSHQFKHILAWALDHNYSYPEKYISEIKHYHIDEKLIKIRNKNP